MKKITSLVKSTFKLAAPSVSVRKELISGHQHPETAFLYNYLQGINWDELDADVISRSYGNVFLASDDVFAYFLPAVLLHVLQTKDVTALNHLCRRTFGDGKHFDIDRFRYRFNLNQSKLELVALFLKSSLKHYSLEWKERSQIENFLEVLVTDKSKSKPNQRGRSSAKSKGTQLID